MLGVNMVFIQKQTILGILPLSTKNFLELMIKNDFFNMAIEFQNILHIFGYQLLAHFAAKNNWRIE